MALQICLENGSIGEGDIEARPESISFQPSPRVRIFDRIGFGQWFRYFTGTLQVAGAFVSCCLQRTEGGLKGTAMSNLPGFTAEQSLCTPFNYYGGVLRVSHSMTNKGIVSSAALALGRRTVEDCLNAGLCANVNTKGRVTCGPCPGQVLGGDRIGLFLL
jgi:hypothetical protein